MLSSGILRVTNFVEVSDSSIKVFYRYSTSESSKVSDIRNIEFPIGGENNVFKLFLQTNALNKLSKYFIHWMPPMQNDYLIDLERVISDKFWLDAVEDIVSSIPREFESMGLKYEDAIVPVILDMISKSLYYYTIGQSSGYEEFNLSEIYFSWRMG